MQTYQLRLKIELVPCSESSTNAPIKQADGSVQITLSEADAFNIDVSVNRRCYRRCIPRFGRRCRPISGMSQKKALEHLNGGTVVKKSRTYWVDGETGRFEFSTYQVCAQGKTIYNTVGDVFPGLKCWEW